jgi:hypothetical protein
MQTLLESMIKLLSMLTLTAILTGCASTRTEIISADREVIYLPAGQPYMPKANGWFVPDARMLEIKNALSKARIAAENK